jgi:hypothetical protein
VISTDANVWLHFLEANWIFCEKKYNNITYNEALRFSITPFESKSN